MQVALAALQQQRGHRPGRCFGGQGIGGGFEQAGQPAAAQGQGRRLGRVGGGQDGQQQGASGQAGSRYALRCVQGRQLLAQALGLVTALGHAGPAESRVGRGRGFRSRRFGWGGVLRFGRHPGPGVGQQLPAPGFDAGQQGPAQPRPGGQRRLAEAKLGAHGAQWGSIAHSRWGRLRPHEC